MEESLEATSSIVRFGFKRRKASVNLSVRIQVRGSYGSYKSKGLTQVLEEMYLYPIPTRWTMVGYFTLLNSVNSDIATKRKLPSRMYRQGTNPLCTSTREFFILFCILFDCYVIGGLFVGVVANSFHRSTHARFLLMQIYEFILRNNICCMFFMTI